MMSGIHSGLAIKRQRKRRQDQRRAQARRFSIRSNDSGMSSLGSLDGGTRARRKRDNNATESLESNVGIGMLHIGVVFIVLGILLLGSGLMPDDFGKFEWQDLKKLSTWWNELVVTGAFALLLGIFLVVLNRFISTREDEELEDYVARQLNRSRSGHALVRDVETGNLTTKRSKSSNLAPDDVRKSMVEDIPEIHHVKSPPPVYDNHPHFFPNGDVGLLSPQLEQIDEEPSERGIGAQTEGFLSTTASMSTMSPSETEELLIEQPYASAMPVPRAETSINMMGAMPAVAVRLERRKAENRLKRPSQLYLSGYNLRQGATASSPNRTSPSPSPLLSPPKDFDDVFVPEIYVCGNISALHLAVVSLLLGAVILIVGLVQLKPGADAPGHRYYLIGIGCSLELIGLTITMVRCIMLHCKLQRRSKARKLARSSASQQGATTTTEGDGGDGKGMPLSIDLKHLYNSSDVMYMDDSDTSARVKSPLAPTPHISTIVLLEGKRPIGPDSCSLAMASPTEFDNLLTDQGGGT